MLKVSVTQNVTTRSSVHRYQRFRAILSPRSSRKTEQFPQKLQYLYKIKEVTFQTIVIFTLIAARSSQLKILHYLSFNRQWFGIKTTFVRVFGVIKAQFSPLALKFVAFICRHNSHLISRLIYIIFEDINEVYIYYQHVINFNTLKWKCRCCVFISPSQSCLFNWLIKRLAPSSLEGVAEE